MTTETRFSVGFSLFLPSQMFSCNYVQIVTLSLFIIIHFMYKFYHTHKHTHIRERKKKTHLVFRLYSKESSFHTTLEQTNKEMSIIESYVGCLFFFCFVFNPFFNVLRFQYLVDEESFLCMLTHTIKL